MRNDRYLTPEDQIVLRSIKEGYADAEEIKLYCTWHGVEIPDVSLHTRRLKRLGYIIRKTSNRKYSNVWEVL